MFESPLSTSVNEGVSPEYRMLERRRLGESLHIGVVIGLKSSEVDHTLDRVSSEGVNRRDGEVVTAVVVQTNHLFRLPRGVAFEVIVRRHHERPLSGRLNSVAEISGVRNVMHSKVDYG